MKPANDQGKAKAVGEIPVGTATLQRRSALFAGLTYLRQVLECGCPLPLFPARWLTHSE